VYKDNLDDTSILIRKVQKDKKILPIIVEKIFLRNREGLFTHDLIWAFFQVREPHSLMLIADYLGSKDPRDVKLAGELLDFVPSIDMTRQKDNRKQYLDFLYWLQENYLFLYYTGESFQRTSKPIPYMVALDAKYLYKPVSIITGKPLTPFTEKENNLLAFFNDLDEENKLLLSKFSFRFHFENIYLWQSWINHSITQQISIAKARLGSW